MRALHLVWILLASLALSSGCARAKHGSSSEMSEPGYYGSDCGGDCGGAPMDQGITAYSFDDDMISADALAPDSVDFKTRSKLADSRRDFDTEGEAERVAPASPVSPEPENTSTTALAPVDPAKPVDTDPAPVSPAERRQVIYTANMQISVYQVEDAVNFAETMPERLGGWVESRSDNLIVLRVPAAKLETAMTLLGERGVVDMHTLEARDVTAQYTDLDSRIRILAETQAQLEKLLARAKTVEQALEIRKALDAVTMELELARARMRELSSSIAFSTLIVRFTQRGPAEDLPSTNDPFPWVFELGVEATEYR